MFMSRGRQWLNIVFGLILSVMFIAGALITRELRFILSACALTLMSVFLFIDTLKNNKSNNLAIGDVSTILTKNVSKWSHLSFYLGLASITVIPIPFAFIFGVIGIIDSNNNQKKGVWRAWTGILLSLALTALYIPLIISVIDK